ncbi:hypothetical protein QWY31_01550 [Cytophagales bacterium LB-30]|uniref:ATP-grasp domain-containing protein n=1 Tax=Shiella aurantiaca TaxID=3058365 RepID=A0ABT8F154_9BACT|nr:hypothetical protein [Shiella aurantiaca]MDN4164162.1 hypothetical protein [Shiella aurantiaca]
MSKSKSSLTWVKWTHFEYWPWWFFYLPTFPYWFWLALKSRRLLYFTAANPGIEYGGFFGESKQKILDLIPSEYLPRYAVIQKIQSEDELIACIQTDGFTFPLIAKPDVGERGNEVRKIYTSEELIRYHQQAEGDYILQEFITFPIELGVLYYRFPDGSEEGISSITMKEFMTVTGDGQHNIRELMEQVDRYRFQIERFSQEHPQLLTQIPSLGESVLLEPIGNHCRGTKFLNGNHLITPSLNQVFGQIVERMEGFYFGRFDMKVSSWEDLQAGKNIRIMEVNGTTSEPAHIYDPSYSLRQAYKDIFYHMRLVQKIAVQNIKKGVKTTPKGEFLSVLRKHFIG